MGKRVKVNKPYSKETDPPVLNFRAYETRHLTGKPTMNRGTTGIGKKIGDRQQMDDGRAFEMSQKSTT